MHHRVAHLDSRRKPVDKNPAHLVFQQWQQSSSQWHISRVHLEGSRELAFQASQQIPHLVNVPTTNEHRTWSKNFVPQLSVTKKAGRVSRKEMCPGATPGRSSLTYRDRLDTLVLSQELHTRSIRSGDSWRQHDAGHFVAQRLGRCIHEVIEFRPFDCDDDTGIGAELAYAQSQRVRKCLADTLGTS